MLKDQRGIIHLLVLLILLGGIIVGVYLIKTGNLKLFPKATNPPIVFKNVDGSSLPLNSSGVPVSRSSNVRIELTSTLGPPATTYPTPSYTYPTPSIYSTPYATPPYATPSYGTPSYGTPSYAYPTPITPSPTPTAMRVFVTSTTYNGNLGGLSGADQKCQTAANSANLGGSWKAWLSDDITSVSSRLTHSSSPYKLMNGTTIANSWNDLTDATLANPINIDETGIVVPSNQYAWTNTTYYGAIEEGSFGSRSCTDWTNSASTVRGHAGEVNATSNYWSSLGADAGCNNNFHLYCFEQGSVSVQGVSAGSVSGPITTGTVSYKIAENPTDLGGKVELPYTARPTVIDYTFQSSTPGQKFIWVEFKSSTGQTDRKSAQIELVAPTPSPGTGAFEFNFSDPITFFTCRRSDPACKYTTTLTATNKLNQTLYNNTVYQSDPRNIIPGPDDRIVLASETSPGAVAFNAILTFLPPQDIGQYSGTLYLDGQTCNKNTNPPDCYFYGASSAVFTITVGTNNVLFQVVNNSPSASPSPSLTPTPSPTPISGPFNNLSASLTSGRAQFNFTYDNSEETLFKVHLSETKNFSFGVYYNFVTGSASPLVETNTSKMSQYQCGATLYWQVEAVYTGGILSPVQSATISCPSPTPTPEACTIQQFASSFGSGRGDIRYIPACDVNSDGAINIFDIYDLLKV